MKTKPYISVVSIWKTSFVSLAVGVASIATLHVAHADLIGFYSFDDPSAPLVDESGQGNDLQSASADPTYQETGGIQGGAYLFDGSQRWISPINLNLDANPTLTMGAWVKTASTSPGLRKIMGQDDGGWDRVIGLDDRNAGLRYTAFDGTGPIVGTPAPANTNDWTFIAAVYDGLSEPKTISFYLDLDATTVGPLFELTKTTSFGNGLSTTSIGSIRPDNNSEGWQGLIDNVFFFNTVLTREELAAIRDRGKAAILGVGGDDPDLQIGALADLNNLPKVPSIHAISIPVRNAGLTKTLNVSGVTFSGTDASHFTVTSFPATIAPGGSANVEVSLDSKGQVGRFETTVNLQSNDAANPTVSVELLARVVSAGALVGYYSFDDAANPLKDDSGSGRTLITGADGGAADPTYLSGGGFSGGAYDFNGAQRLVVPLNINPSALPSLTIGAWVKAGTIENGLRKVIGHDDGAWDRVIGLDTRVAVGGGPLPDGTLRYAAFTGENNFGPTQGDPPPTPTSTDAWTFVAAHYDQAAGQVSLYVDLDASTQDDDPQVVTSAAAMGNGVNTTSIGSISPGGSGEGWVGSIDNVFFLSGSPDAATIKAIRNGGRTTLLQFTPDPVLGVDSASPFASLPDAAPKTASIVVRNVGLTQPLTITAAILSGKDVARYALGALPAPIAPGGQGTIQVTFNPQNTPGAYLASLRLISNDAADRHTTVDLSADVPFSNPAASLIGFYPFDDDADPLKDMSGKGNNLSYVSGAEPVHQPGLGFEGSSFDFSGSQRLIAPLNINPDTAPKLTMGAWVKTASLTSGLRKIMGHDDGGWDRVIGLDNRLSAGGTTPLRYLVFLGNGLPLADTTPLAEDTEIWTFIAAVFDQSASRVTLYVDLDSSTHDDEVTAATFPTSFGTGFQTLSIGSLRPDNASEGWVGMIDNVFVYQSTLTAQQIKAIRDGGSAAILPGGNIVITLIQRTDKVQITWASAAGKNYSVLYTQSLDTPFSSIASLPGLAGSTSYTDADAARLSKSTGFYRIAEAP